MRYNGSAQVTQGLLTNSVQYTLDAPSAAFSLIQDGKFRVLAKFDPRPFPPVPDVPLLSEAAKLSSFDEITVWLGLVAPKGTPQPIVEKLQRQVAQVLAEPGIKQKADADGTLSVHIHARGVCRLHPQGGGALGAGGEGNRDSIRLAGR